MNFNSLLCDLLDIRKYLSSSFQTLKKETEYFCFVFNKIFFVKIRLCCKFICNMHYFLHMHLIFSRSTLSFFAGRISLSLSALNITPTELFHAGTERCSMPSLHCFSPVDSDLRCTDNLVMLSASCTSKTTGNSKSFSATGKGINVKIRPQDLCFLFYFNAYRKFIYWGVFFLV